MRYLTERKRRLPGYTYRQQPRGETVHGPPADITGTTSRLPKPTGLLSNKSPSSGNKKASSEMEHRALEFRSFYLFLFRAFCSLHSVKIQ